jgi:hypothetical protein
LLKTTGADFRGIHDQNAAYKSEVFQQPSGEKQ